MTDKELLELAAKAAGLPKYFDGMGVEVEHYPTWKPLTDDGDALRLAVKLRFCVNYLSAGSDYPPKPHGVIVTPFSQYSVHWPPKVKWVIERGEDEYAATRRAIVRAAAEIGKEMNNAQP